MQAQILRETKSAAYYTEDTRFASFVSFFSYFDNRQADTVHPLVRTDFEYLENTRKRLWTEGGAFHAFYSDTDEYTHKYFDAIWERLSNFFPDLPKPDLFFVDSPASVFAGAHTGWDAMCVERGDSCGVPSGIYFSQYRLTHLYYEFLITHELIHWVMGEMDKSEQNPTYLPIVEEGVCDLLALYLMQEELDLSDTVIENIMLYNRAYIHHNPLCKAYWFALQNTARYVRAVGVLGVIDLIRSKGRSGLEVILERNDTANIILTASESRLCESVDRVSGILQLPLAAFGELNRSIKRGVHAAVGIEPSGDGWQELTDYALIYESDGELIQPNKESLLNRVRYYID